MEINQYPLESLTFQDNDFYDIDFWTGSGYQTRKILGSVIKAGIAAAVQTLYNSDGTLDANRVVDFDGNNLNFVDASGNSTFDVEINDGTNYTKLTQDVLGYFIKAFSSGLETSFLNVQGNQMKTETNDGGSYISSLVQTAFYCEWLKQNGIQYTRIRQESGQIFIEYNNGVGVSNTLTVDVEGTKINGLYLLPNTDGTTGQVMTTDGVGVVSWQDSATTIISWGDIVGTLSDQTDLRDALDAKLNYPEGVASQYIRGDGTLGIFPSVGGGGGGSVYYFNGNTSQGTIGGQTMYQLSKVAQTGAPANFNRSTTGTIASFITDVNDPNQLSVPSGIWLFECYLSETGGGANHATVQCIVEKWDGTTISVIGTGVVEQLTNGNVKDLYTLGVTIPSGITLSATDRIVVQVQVANPNGKTITLYTENNDVSSVTTTFSNGISSLNGLSPATQLLTTGTSGTDFTINSSGNTHTFNIPTADATKTGKLSSTDWSTFNNKVDDNVYTADGTLTGTRIVDLNSEGISFQDSNETGGAFTVNIDNGTKLSSLALNPNVFDLELINAGVGSVITGTSTNLLLRYIGASANKQIEVKNNGIQVNGTYYLPNTDGTSGQVVTTDGAGNLSFTTISGSTAIPEVIQLAASDETTALTTGTAKITFRMPYAMTLTAVRASLSTAQASGSIFTIDINEGGTTILSTKLTIDNTEKTSTTAATPAVISDSALADDAEITIDIDQIGNGTAKGLKITLIGTRV